MVRGENRTGHGEGWRRWCHGPRDNPGLDVVSLRRGIIRWYAQQLWLDAATGVTGDSVGEGKVLHRQFVSVQDSDSPSSKSPGFICHCRGHRTIWPTKDKCDNFIALVSSLLPHWKPSAASLWEPPSSWMQTTSAHSSPLYTPQLPSFWATTSQQETQRSCGNWSRIYSAGADWKNPFFLKPILTPWSGCAKDLTALPLKPRSDDLHKYLGRQRRGAWLRVSAFTAVLKEELSGETLGDNSWL